MHVAVDARYVSRLQSGIGLYTEHLLRALAAIDPTTRYTYLAVRNGPDPGIRQPNFSPCFTRISFENHLVGDLWQSSYLPVRLAALGVDLYHGPAVFLPLVKLGYRTVVTIHDLVAFLFPETVPTKYGTYMRWMTRLSARTADRIIADSEATRRDLVRLLGVPGEKVRTIPAALGTGFEPVRDPARLEAVRRTYQLEGPYLLFVGNLEPRKNLVRLIEAYAVLRRRFTLPHRLVLAGKKGWLYRPIFQAVERLGLQREVVFTGYIAPADLPAVYSMADAFAFPSLYEGFGLPVLEAMACGVPVVAGASGSIPEVVGDAALLVPSLEVEAIAEALYRVLTDAGLRAELTARGRERSRAFSWERVAIQTREVYEQVHARGRP